jgi:hypothetical protein
VPAQLKSLGICIECSRLSGWAVGSWRSTGLTAVNAPACGAVEDELLVFMECPASNSLRARYGSDLGFQGRSLRTIMTEAPQLALASFLSEIWETRHVALRRIALKRTTEGDDDLPRHRNISEQLSMGPLRLQRAPPHLCGT